MKKLILSYIMVLALLIGLAYGNDLYSALFLNKKTRKVSLLKKHKKPVKMKRLLKKKISKKNKLYSLGRHYFRKGKCDKGNRYYKRALKLDPNNDKAFKKMVVYMKQCLKYKKKMTQNKLK